MFQNYISRGIKILILFCFLTCELPNDRLIDLEGKWYMNKVISYDLINNISIDFYDVGYIWFYGDTDGGIWHTYFSTDTFEYSIVEDSVILFQFGNAAVEYFILYYSPDKMTIQEIVANPTLPCGPGLYLELER